MEDRHPGARPDVLDHCLSLEAFLDEYLVRFQLWRSEGSDLCPRRDSIWTCGITIRVQARRRADPSDKGFCTVEREVACAAVPRMHKLDSLVFVHCVCASREDVG